MCPQKKYYDENKEKLNQHAGNDYRPEGDKEKAKQHYENNKEKLQEIAQVSLRENRRTI